MLVRIDQERADRRVPAVGFQLVQPDTSLAGSVEGRGDAAVAQAVTPDVQPDARPELADDPKHRARVEASIAGLAALSPRLEQRA